MCLLKPLSSFPPSFPHCSIMQCLNNLTFFFFIASVNLPLICPGVSSFNFFNTVPIPFCTCPIHPCLVTSIPACEWTSPRPSSSVYLSVCVSVECPSMCSTPAGSRLVQIIGSFAVQYILLSTTGTPHWNDNSASNLWGKIYASRDCYHTTQDNWLCHYFQRSVFLFL